MQLVALGLQEEDCKFREFPDEGWSGLNEDEEANLWENNLDDDNVEGNFSSQFCGEPEKQGYKHPEVLKQTEVELVTKF